MENGWLEPLFNVFAWQHESERAEPHVMFFPFQSNKPDNFIAYPELFFSPMSIFDKLVCQEIIPQQLEWALSANHVIFSDMMFWRASVGKICTELQPKSCHLFVCVFSERCVSWHQGDWGCLFLCHHPLKGEVIKSSMGATSCSSLLHFEAFYLEMNRRPLHNEGGEENILLEAEDVGGCAIAYRHLVWNSPVVPDYRRALSTEFDAGIIIILSSMKA